MSQHIAGDALAQGGNTSYDASNQTPTVGCVVPKGNASPPIDAISNALLYRPMGDVAKEHF
jgi:hypothetical protein